MLSIARRTAAGAAILLIMPLAVWVSGWMWQPGHNTLWLKTLYWITETVTQPWGIITHVVLCARFCGACAFVSAQRWCFAILGGAILVGRGKISGERPCAGAAAFVVWLENASCSGE